MTNNLRIFGWLLIGMGVVFGGVTTLSMLGAFPLRVEVLDFEVTGTRSRLIFVASCGACVLLGVGLVLLARRRVALASRSANGGWCRRPLQGSRWAQHARKSARRH